MLSIIQNDLLNLLFLLNEIYFPFFQMICVLGFYLWLNKIKYK